MATAPDRMASSTPGLVPVPDPTTLTNEAVERAVSALREVMEVRLQARDHVVAANRTAVEDRFELLDRQTIKAAADVKSAVDAAFAAAASGVSQQNQANFLASQKQEAAFTKQIDQLTTSVLQISKAADDKLTDLKKTTDDKVGDLKDRLVAMEGRSSGRGESTAWMFTAIMALVALGSLAVALFRTH